MAWWIRGDKRTTLSGNVLTFVDKGPLGTTFNNSGGAGSITVAAGDVNGRDAFHIVAPNQANDANTVFYSPSQPFSWAGVIKNTTLGTGDYTVPFTVAGVDPNNSSTLFMYNDGSDVMIYFQSGNGTITHITASIAGVYTAYATYVFTYNGGGLSSAANYTFLLNGVSQTLSSGTAGGGDSNANSIGNQSRAGSQDGMYVAENIFWTNYQLTSPDTTQLLNYFYARYLL
jgi:hypothetical protein